MLYRSIKPLIVDAIQVTESSDLPTAGGIVHVEPGDWLMFDSQGNLTRCDDINFKCTYAVLESPGDIGQFREGKPCGC
ncbi:MAG: hypothetical protein LAP21_07705 [Acidobacteriia bacterium]|nr:hypothetical protein [Terriglobia bacterium]